MLLIALINDGSVPSRSSSGSLELEHLNGMQSLLVLKIKPVLFLCEVQISVVKKVSHNDV